MKKTKKFLVIILSAVMVFTLAFAASAADAGYEEYAGYQFPGTDPWGAQLNVTIRNVEKGLMSWTYTEDFGTEMIYKELSQTSIDPATHKADFYIEGNYVDSLSMIYNYGGTIELIDGKVIITYEYGETVTQSPEGDSSSRQVKALAPGKNVVILTKNIPSGGIDGWALIDGKWYFGVNGELVTGWLFDGYNWYYMDYSGVMQTGWVWDGAWYYLSGSGAMQTGWVYDDLTWYYMDESGAMVTGWVWYNGNWYYMTFYGAMVTGDYTIDGVVNHFDSNGAWISFK